MRASSRLSLEEGMITCSCCAWAALRRRVRKSETGSVIAMRSPRALGHPRDVTVVRELAQADPADAELAVHRARAAAAPAAGVAPGRVFRCPLLADALRGLGHVVLSSMRALARLGLWPACGLPSRMASP